MPPVLRVARPTACLEQVLAFYRDGLGLEVLACFEDHDGFDGVILGQPAGPYHLEFTRQHGHTAPRSPSADNLLVFYLPERTVWAAAVARMRAHGFEPIPSLNPYWDARGHTFEDCDGYRVVLQNAAWGA